MSPGLKRLLSILLLAAILLLLALRLGSNETLRETLAQKGATAAAAAAPRSPDNPGPIPLVGPAYTAAYAGIVLVLAGAATLLVGPAAARRLPQLALIAVILGLLAFSAARAGNRFNAAVGMLDLATALVSAWALALLCDDALLGRAGRQAAIAGIVAILAMGAAKALMQYFIDYPDLMQYIKEHPDERLRQQGLDPRDTAAVKAFMARLNSQEVTGFGLYANVFATQSVACAGLLAGLLVAAVRSRAPKAVPVPEARDEKRAGKKKPTLDYAGPRTRTPGQVPLHILAIILIGILAVAALAVLPMTDSNGGMAATVLCIVAIIAGGIFAGQIVARRRLLLAAAAVVALAGAAAVVGYGITQHRLPTKSLLFRWQYWTASAPIMRQFPAWGVGLNNFGDYYLQYKAPSSPEDVKDPHSFFVRLASEAGLPAAFAVAALLLWFLWRSFAQARPASPQTGEFPWPAIVLASAVGLAWAPLHMLGLAYTDFEAILSFLYALFGVGAFAAVLYLLWHLEDRGLAIAGIAPTRFVAVAGVIAALGMFLYDQINMALVTGPCAMLLWILLAVGDSSAGLPARKAGKLWPALAGTLACAAGVATLLFFAIPISAGTTGLDPAPLEYEYLRQFGDLAAALERHDARSAADYAAGAGAALDHALELSPQSGELVMQRITFHRYLADQHLPSAPLADDIRRVFSLDRANARIRLDLALPDSDLPKEERIAALEEALRFDAALPADEAKRLSDAQKTEVREKIAALRGASHP